MRYRPYPTIPNHTHKPPTLPTQVNAMRYRPSPKLLELEDQERRLARSKEYTGAAEIGARAKRLRAREEASFEEQRNQV